MSQFIGLRFKLYELKIFGEEKEKKKAKGVTSSTLKAITFNDYEKSLFHFKKFIKTTNI